MANNQGPPPSPNQSSGDESGADKSKEFKPNKNVNPKRKRKYHKRQCKGGSSYDEAKERRTNYYKPLNVYGKTKEELELLDPYNLRRELPESVALFEKAKMEEEEKRLEEEWKDLKTPAPPDVDILEQVWPDWIDVVPREELEQRLTNWSRHCPPPPRWRRSEVDCDVALNYWREKKDKETLDASGMPATTSNAPIPEDAHMEDNDDDDSGEDEI
ncbi:unnamed protein product [Caenorhabditis angaria]|uniref:Uncharacterized protein n=1 Tax=Caenorhabditis angaria TaxID=860376 RepID=A0A9P1J3Y6_9PELO|nr:unnamed protein product [Caenorhabditis angaria]